MSTPLREALLTVFFQGYQARYQPGVSWSKSTSDPLGGSGRTQRPSAPPAKKQAPANITDSKVRQSLVSRWEQDKGKRIPRTMKFTRSNKQNTCLNQEEYQQLPPYPKGMNSNNHLFFQISMSLGLREGMHKCQWSNHLLGQGCIKPTSRQIVGVCSRRKK